MENPIDIRPINRKKSPKILLIVIKNSSVLDFALPLLWKIKNKNPQTEISVLYYQISRWKVLRKDNFYSPVMSRLGIREYDFSDFLRLPYQLFGVLWRRLFSKPAKDGSIFHLLQYTLFRKMAGLESIIFRSAENFILNKVDSEKILPFLDPDIILLDNRFHNLKRTFHGGIYFHDYFASARKKLILLPHGAHHGKVDEFRPFDKDDFLPDYCEYWIPFRFDRNWENIPGKRSQFFHVGYPGLDSEWLNWLNTRKGGANNTFNNRKKTLKVLYITRKFAKQEEPEFPLKEFILTHDEFIYYFKLIKNALDKLNAKTELVVKPHPNNDFIHVKKVLNSLDCGDVEIDYDSIYSNLYEYDFIISLYSTTILMPIMAGIPVILIHSRWQEEVHTWEKRRELYTNLHLYLKNEEDLAAYLEKALRIACDQKAWKKDIQHLRYYWPDGAMGKCLERLGV